MEHLIIVKTDDTPEIDFNPGSKEMKISGRSLPEDVTVFYNPILKWLEEYAAAPKNPTILVLKMDYFNTASSKLILDILMKLEEIHEEHSCVKVEWHHLEDDEDMQEAGEEFADIVEIPFEIKAY